MPSPPAVGRRRCGIPEHRKQIKAMQKWCAFLQAQQGGMWARDRINQVERNALQAEARRARWDWFLYGVGAGCFALIAIAWLLKRP